jgi:hypothetical protein
MRLVVKGYDNDNLSAVEMTTDGTAFVKQLAGDSAVDKQTSAYVEVACNDTDDSMNRVLLALSWLQEEVEKRTLAFQNKDGKGRPRGSRTDHVL